MASRMALVLGLLAAQLLPVAPARGQSQQVRLAAAAREFFAQGITFADQSQWVQAADRFRRALSIRHSPVIAFNLASSLEELGELTEASELLYGLEGDPEADATLRTSARALLADIRPRLATLTVLVPDDHDHDHDHGRAGAVHVVLDGAALDPVQLGVPIPVDPGAHEVVFIRRTLTLQRDPLELEPGGSATVALSAARVPTPAEVAALDMARRNAANTDPDTPVTRRWWFWAGVGTVAIGVVAAITIVTLSRSPQRAN